METRLDIAIHEVREGLKRIEFAGTRLSEVSTETLRKPQWIEMELYRVYPRDPANSERYFVQIIGRSLLYHAYRGGCATGTPVKYAAIPRDAEPCRRCKPLPNGIVKMESDRYALYRCTSAQHVVKSLAEGPGQLGKLSNPAIELLQTAAAKDPDIAAAINVREVL
jgi:hypothetical protein